MNIHINKILSAGFLVGCSLAAVFTACSDTWDDHYDSLGDGTGMHEGTLWQAIKSDPTLSNFASVIEGCDFAKTLDGSQVFTIFAPTNDQFSQSEAQALIASYRQQVADSVVEENNTVLKEFIQNHVALYNYSVSGLSNDSITLMNGKYAVLTSDNVGGVAFSAKNQLYGNGVLFKLAAPISYLPNVFEYVRTDADLDSLRSFLYNSRFYYREFQPSLSVPGSIVNGKTQYLDSVFSQVNELYSYLGRLASEDSSYVMVAPTNAVWRELVEKYEPYFNYPEDVAYRDSLVYTNTRMAIVQGTTFSGTFNTEQSLRDSAISVQSYGSYAIRKLLYGQPFEYNMYRNPLSAGGALDQTDIKTCSNGQVRKATQWNIDELMTFQQYIVVEASNRNAVKEVKQVTDGHGDLINTFTWATQYVTSENRYYDRLWSNNFVEFSPTQSVQPWVSFNLSNVHSNVGYDIYLVTAPALASDSNATDIQRLAAKMRCTINQPGHDAQMLTNVDGSNDFITTPDAVDYLLLAEDFKFDVCTYGVDDDDMQVTLQVEARASNSEVRNNKYTRTLRIDCILLVPHGTLELVDALPQTSPVPQQAWGTPGVLMYPHGHTANSKWWYMQR